MSKKTSPNKAFVLTMRIKNSSHYSFKDLVINCGYEAASGTHLGENKFTVYQAFFRGGTRTIRNLGGGDIPHQTHTVSCAPVDFIELTDQEDKRLEKQLLDEIFEITPNKSSNLTGAENAPAS